VRTALWAELPAKREFYREIWRFLLAFTDGAARHPTQLTALSSLWRAVVAQKEQGIFSEYQGIKVPCYVLVQRKFRQKHTLLIEGSGRAMIGIICEAYPSVAFNNCGIGDHPETTQFLPRRRFSPPREVPGILESLDGLQNEWGSSIRLSGG
jgi:hypothetical protein